MLRGVPPPTAILPLIALDFGELELAQNSRQCSLCERIQRSKFGLKRDEPFRRPFVDSRSSEPGGGRTLS